MPEHRERTWPSRRIQIGFVAVLALAAAVQVFVPPLTREGRAEKLYEDAWHTAKRMTITEPDPKRMDAAIKKLEAALKLSPGNSRYEQMLVFLYPEGKLPELIASDRIGKDGKLLAAGLIFRRKLDNFRSSSSAAAPALPGMPGPPGVSREAQTSPEDLLKSAEELCRVDPDNGLAHYYRATVLKRTERPDEAVQAVRTGNRCREFRFYRPEASLAMLDSMISPIDVDFDTGSTMRDLARLLMNQGNARMRSGDISGAREMFEDCCLMGINYSSCKPHDTITFLVGKAVFGIGKSGLDPLYRDWGMKDPLSAIKRTDTAFEKGVGRTKSNNDGAMERFTTSLARVSALPFFTYFTVAVAYNLLVLMGLLWLPPRIAAKRRSQDVLRVMPWGQGWLASILFVVYLPAIAVLVAALMIAPQLLSLGPGTYDAMASWIHGAVFVPLAQIVFLVAAVRILHHRYDQHTGDRTGIFRFIFKAPANAKAWTRKYVAAALLAQIVFMGCVFLALTTFYEPVFGGHPWQFERFRVGGTSHEQALVADICKDLAVARQSSEK